MITGDHAATASAIAAELGIADLSQPYLTGTDLDAISDEELRDHVRSTNVYARVSPQHKLRIVQALKANGETVAVTGDGVNDAPALRAADVGVAMGKAVPTLLVKLQTLYLPTITLSLFAMLSKKGA